MKNVILVLLFLLMFNILLSEDGYLHRVIPGIEDRAIRDNPPEGEEIVSPAEFSHCEGIIISYVNWSTELLHDIARAVADQYAVYVLVENEIQQAIASDNLESADVNMENVSFIFFDQISAGSIWIRDSGPFYIYEDGLPAIVDYYYGLYPGDDNIPAYCADYFEYPRYESSILHHGGNYISDGNGMAFATTNITQYNNETISEIQDNFETYMGIDSLVVISTMENDGTGHIDMFCKLLTDNKFIVGYYENAEDGFGNNQQILNENADILDEMTNLYGQDYEVTRIFMPPFVMGGLNGSITYTYTNSLIINDIVLVPVYGFDSDAVALEVYESILPDHEIIGINSADIIEWWGAVHCVAQLHYGENPLIILHDVVTDMDGSIENVIRFRSNPKFNDMAAELHYRDVNSPSFVTLSATQQNGVWEVNLPVLNHDFEYYLSVSAYTANGVLHVTCPENLSDGYFYVNVVNTMVEQDFGHLIQNVIMYPNPLLIGTQKSNTINLDFNLSEATQVQIKIYNIKGQCVKQLTNENFRSGMNSICWNGKDRNSQFVSPGLYLYHINTGEDKLYGKFVVIR
ncbi:MAG: agmatine deiminase family protein [Candidatus Cloacimonetes bacterium]|nr:agmatine deiminase family protein [Candidatus Cloacimonadota bacterium]